MVAPVVIFGAGAVGSVLGARLSGRQRVLLVGRWEHIEAIRRYGLRIEGTDPGRFELDARPALQVSETVEAVILTVKSFDLESAAASITTTISEPVPILAIQNGLGIEGRLEKALELGGWDAPERWIVRGVNSVPVTFLAPGVVRQSGTGEIVVGAPRAEVPTAVVERFVSMLTGSGVAARRSENLGRDVWTKAIVNAGINPVTADHDVLNGALTHEPFRGQALRLVREAAMVARAEGVDISDDEAERETLKVIGATSENASSMLQDIRVGRPTEIDAISGEVLARGRLHHLQLPSTERALSRIRHRVAAGARPSTEPPSF